MEKKKKNRTPAAPSVDLVPQSLPQTSAFFDMLVATAQEQDPDNAKVQSEVLQSITTAATISKTKGTFYPQRIEKNIVTTGAVEQFLSAAQQLPEDALEELHLVPPVKTPPVKEQETLETVLKLDDTVLNSPLVHGTIDTFDRAVLESVYTQLLGTSNERPGGNPIFTFRTLYRYMTGKVENNVHLTDAHREALRQSIVRLMGTMVDIEVVGTREDGTQFVARKTEPLLPATIEEINVAGNSTVCIRVLDYPSFLAFATLHKGLAATPLDILQLPVAVSKKSVSILNHLVHLYSEVTYSESAYENRMKLPDPKYLDIPIQSIYDVCKPENDPTPIPKQITIRIRKTVEKILNSWVEKSFIQSWSFLTGRPNTSSTEIVACRLVLPPLSDEQAPEDS